MIVGLIILLVVAAVVISLILYFMRKETIEPLRKGMEKTKFKQQCEMYCNDVSSLEYCRYYWNGNDWNQNGIKGELIKVEESPYKWMTCEDRVYCFLYTYCDRFGRGINAMEKCRELLCQTYLEKYNGDVDAATQALLDDISFSTSCSMVNNPNVPSIENWYERVFAQGCAGTGGVTPSPQLSFSCTGPTSPDVSVKGSVTITCTGDQNQCLQQLTALNLMLGNRGYSSSISGTTLTVDDSCNPVDSTQVLEVWCKRATGASVNDVINYTTNSCPQGQTCSNGAC